MVSTCTLLTSLSLWAGVKSHNDNTMRPHTKRRPRARQHRVRSARRTVPYPPNHPMSRHLQIETARDFYSDDYHSDSSIVGGDGWSDHQRRRHQSRLLSHSRIGRTASHKMEPERMRERQGIHKYWTVTGRNLVSEVDAKTTDESLLVDASDSGADMNYDDNGNTSEEGSMSAESISATDQSGSVESISRYQPIRLRAILTDDDSSGSTYLTASQRRILMEDMINPALYAWSKALHVIPADQLVVDMSQLYDGISCGPGLDSGLPSVKVPQDHMTDGLADTDTVIYISVSFNDNTMSLFSQDTNYLHRSQNVPTFRGTTRIKDNATSFTNLLDKNSTYYPSISPSESSTITPSETEPFIESRPTCAGNYLASATYCSTDQYDRPIAGILSICIDDIQTFFDDKNQIERNIVTIMHEMGHILGFNAESLAHFRDGDTGEPLTPRDENGDVIDVTVECTGVYPRMEARIPLPSSNITSFKNVRGGVRVAEIVTPTVRRVARNMFGCQSLSGAELESGEWQLFGDDSVEISAGECIGDHWERRLFRTDLLNPIVDDVAYSLYISSLTLAYFADSGWYKVDTHRIAPTSIWGRNAGCNFVTQKCVTKNGGISASNNAFFCNDFFPQRADTNIRTKNTYSTLDTEPEQEIHGCNLDSSSKAICSTAEYDLELPNEYNYFGNSKLLGGDLLGGSDPTLDYCPVFQGYSNGNCGSESAEEYVGVKTSLEVFGESNSRCVIGSVDRKRTSLCMPMACVVEDQTLMVKVDGYWKSCLYAGQIISVWWNRKDYVVCPDPSHLCPTFYCPNDCFKDAGICDYRSGQCMCAPLTNMNSTAPKSWLTTYYSTSLLEPCSGNHLHSQFNGTFHPTERIDVELPEYYVTNTTFLLDDPRDFDDKVSRMFAQLSSGDVVGLVASFMLFIVFSYIIWYQLLKCYRQRLLGSMLPKILPRIKSSLLSVNRQDIDPDYTDSPRTNRRSSDHAHNPQKDKMVATLLVQNRIESNMLAKQIEQQARLELADMASGTQMDQSLISEQPVIINRSELPPLPEGGRVLAIIGGHILEDDDGDDMRSSVTSATHVTNRSMTIDDDHTSPLYQDEQRDDQSGFRRYLNLRHITR